MFCKEIGTLLHKSLTGAFTPPIMVCQKTLRHDVDDLVALVLSGLKLAVVADCNTEKALGGDVFRALKSGFAASLVFLDSPVVADMETVKWLQNQTKHYDALVAVGSGTINDLCKYTAFIDGKPYIVFPTAASMNGYLSANASISVDGFKTTLKAQMPQAVFCDLEVITSAPIRLSKSGLGDCLARPTAQADWLLSHLVLDTTYNETPFTLLESVEPALFDNARGIAKADPQTVELLVQALLLSGLGMTIAGGSYPASQGEHMVAHAYGMLDMQKYRNADDASAFPTLHGEEIGVTTLAIAQLQENMLRRSPALRLEPFPARKIIELFGDKVAQEAGKAYQIKLELMQTARSYDWNTIAERLQPIMLPSKNILAILQAAEAPHTPEMLDWADADYSNAFMHARFLRERFTFLDLV